MSFIGRFIDEVDFIAQGFIFAEEKSSLGESVSQNILCVMLTYE